MTPSAQPFEPSYSALKALHNTIIDRTAISPDITPPDQPQSSTASSYAYLDGAISMLSKSAEYLYTSHAPWVLEVVKARNDVERVHTKIKNFEGDVKVAIEHLHHLIDGLDGQVKSLKHQVDEVRNQVDGRFKGLEGRFTNMGAREPWDDIVPVEYKNQAGNTSLEMVFQTTTQTKLPSYGIFKPKKSVSYLYVPALL